MADAVKELFLLLTRCPIHGRRFQRYCEVSGRDGVKLQRLGGSVCCEHLRARKLRPVSLRPLSSGQEQRG